MSNKMQVEVLAWQTPNFVRLKMAPGLRQDGWKESPSVPLDLVDTDVLARMCDEFRADVFRKTGKPDPAKVG